MDSQQWNAIVEFWRLAGWPGLIYLTVIYGGYRVWVWYTTVKWPQERQDKKDAETARAKREDDWYSLVGRSISRSEMILAILAMVHPSEAAAVMREDRK